MRPPASSPPPTRTSTARSAGCSTTPPSSGARAATASSRSRPTRSKPRVIASLPVKEPAYMHSFGLTERWLVLAEFPFVVNPLALALSGRPYIENYRWKPERGTRFTLVDRASGEATSGFQSRRLLRLPPRQRLRGRRAGRRPVRLPAGHAELLCDFWPRVRAGRPTAAGTSAQCVRGLSKRVCENSREFWPAARLLYYMRRSCAWWGESSRAAGQNSLRYFRKLSSINRAHIVQMSRHSRHRRQFIGAGCDPHQESQQFGRDQRAIHSQHQIQLGCRR